MLVYQSFDYDIFASVSFLYFLLAYSFYIFFQAYRFYIFLLAYWLCPPQLKFLASPCQQMSFKVALHVYRSQICTLDRNEKCQGIKIRKISLRLPIPFILTYLLFFQFSSDPIKNKIFKSTLNISSGSSLCSICIRRATAFCSSLKSSSS